MACGFNLHFWQLWKRDGRGGFLPFVVRKRWKGSQFFRNLVLQGVCVYFQPFFVVLSLLQVLLCLPQRLCTYVPSHPLEQVGASMTDLKSWCRTEFCFPRGTCASSCVTEVLGLLWNNRWFPILNGSSPKCPYKFRIERVSFYSCVCFFPMTVGKGKFLTSGLSDILLFWRTFFASLRLCL